MNIFAVQLNELLNESKNCAIHKKNEWKVPFLDRTGPFCLFFTVFHCFLKLWFVFQFEWIILLNEYFWFNFEWIILLNEYSWFNFELNIELNHFLAQFNVKMNIQNLSPPLLRVGLVRTPYITVNQYHPSSKNFLILKTG